jgi:hypothetical protein
LRIFRALTSPLKKIGYGQTKGKNMGIESEKEAPVTELKELVLPNTDSGILIRRGLELKKQEYSDRIAAGDKPWFKEPDFRKRHDEYPEFRDLNYKFFLIKELTDGELGEKMPVGWAFEQLEKTVGTVDEETFKNAFFTIHMFITGELPLPNSAEIAASLALSPA